MHGTTALLHPTGFQAHILSRRKLDEVGQNSQQDIFDNIWRRLKRNLVWKVSV